MYRVGAILRIEHRKCGASRETSNNLEHFSMNDEEIIGNRGNSESIRDERMHVANVGRMRENGSIAMPR